MTDTVSLSIILNKKLLTGITATQRHLSQNWSPSYPLSLRTNKAKRNAPVSIGTTAALEHVYSFTSSQKTSTLTSQASQLANERLTFSCNTHDDGHSKKKKSALFRRLWGKTTSAVECSRHRSGYYCRCRLSHRHKLID